MLKFNVDNIHKHININRIPDPGIGNVFTSNSGKWMHEKFVQITSPVALQDPTEKMAEKVKEVINELGITSYGIRNPLLEFKTEGGEFLYSILFAYLTNEVSDKGTE